MKLCLSVLLSVFSFFVLPSHAQMGVYINPIGIRVSNSQADSGIFSFLGQGTTSRMFWGANIGFYDDFFHGKNVDVGVDLRDSVVGGNDARLNSFLIGGRVVMKSFSPSWRPYFRFREVSERHERRIRRFISIADNMRFMAVQITS